MKRRSGGFTLLEVMIAMAILGSGVVSVMRLFSGSLNVQDRASRQARAVLFARAAMDALLFEPEVKNHDETRGPTAEGFLLHVKVRPAGPEDGVRKEDFDNASDFGLRYLQVDVTWQDGRGEKTYTLKSLRVAPEDDL